MFRKYRDLTQDNISYGENRLKAYKRKTKHSLAITFGTKLDYNIHYVYTKNWEVQNSDTKVIAH